MIFEPKSWAKLIPSINSEARGYLMFTSAAMFTITSITLPVRKVFGTHTFYEGGGGGEPPPPPYDLENGRLCKLQFWQAIRTIYER